MARIQFWFFWFDSFQRLGQKSVKKGSLFGDLKTPKFHSEINWPLFGCFFMMWTYKFKSWMFLTKGLVWQTCSSKSSKLYHWRGGPQWTRSPSSRYVCRMGEYRVSHGKMYFFNPLHRGAFCQFPFRCIYYYGSNKSTGKETGKTHLC